MLLHRTYGILTRLSLIYCGRHTVCMETLLICDKIAAGSFVIVAAKLVCGLSSLVCYPTSRASTVSKGKFFPTACTVLVYDWKYI